MQGITIKPMCVLTGVFCPRRQPGTFLMMSGQSGYLIELDISSSDYTFPCTLFRVVTHMADKMWCSMRCSYIDLHGALCTLFRKNKSCTLVMVRPGGSLEFYGCSLCFWLFLCTSHFKTSLLNTRKKTNKTWVDTHLDAALKRKRVLKCLNLVNAQHCLEQSSKEISHRGFTGINDGISYNLSSRA